MKFKVEPRLLDHFGIAMYNTVPKAIAELCANAYDADATRVKITYASDAISIVDNGVGMSKSDLEDNYLRLGRDRREDEGTETSPEGRPIIGNKGIGKLAGFGIAQTMVVRTKKGKAQTTIELDREELEEADDLESFEIKPKTRRLKRAGRGTEVKLSRLLDDVALPEERKLREHLARHLPARQGWDIYVNGTECTPEDIAGDRFEISDTIDGFGKVVGFYVVAKDRRSLNAGFAIRVRDRVVQERSLFDLNQQAHGFFNLSRIVGELRPDFLDPIKSSGERRDKFVINTSRSGFNPEDPAVQALEEYAEKKLVSIAAGLTKQRTKDRKKAALTRNPHLERRLKELGPDIYMKLDETLDSVISKLSKNEDDETVDQIVDLIIRYYESDALRIILETVREAAPKDVERLSHLLAEYGAARVGEVTHTLHTQLEVIELLYQKVKEGVLEAEIHKIVAENIWLLRDDLTYWSSNKQFATVLSDKLSDNFKFASEKRPDLVCYDDRTLQPKQGNSAKRLLVIEFKRPGVKVSSEELQQVMTYKSVFEASLGGFTGDDIDVTILGDRFDTTFDRKALRPAYEIMSYEELLSDAADRYRDLYARLVPEGIPRLGDTKRAKKPTLSRPVRAHKKTRRKKQTARGKRVKSSKA
jgi:hypothetical protein